MPMRRTVQLALVLAFLLRPIGVAFANPKERANDCAEVLGFATAPTRYLNLCAEAFPALAPTFHMVGTNYDVRNRGAFSAALGELIELGRATGTPDWTEARVRNLIFHGTDAAVETTWDDAAPRRLDFCSDAVRTYETGKSDITVSIPGKFRACVGYLKSLLY